MKKAIIYIVDSLVFVLCFLFLLISFFKLVSFTPIDELLHTNSDILICIWVIGIFIAVFFTLPLYRWILHFRYPQR